MIKIEIKSVFEKVLFEYEKEDNTFRETILKALCSCANLSGAKNFFSTIDYLQKTFKATDKGLIVYKTFGGMYSPNKHWKIEPNAIIEEVANSTLTQQCGCGINVAPLDWVKKNYNGDIWECLIEWPWLVGVVVPYNTDGKIRASRVRLIKNIERG